MSKRRRVPRRRKGIPQKSARVAASLADIADEAASLRAGIRGSRAMLVAISGIDGSGKTHLSKLLAHELEGAGLRTALIGIDPWQNPQTVRFGGPDAGVHFYHHVIRFDELFAQLVDPLVRTRRIHLSVQGTRTDHDVWEALTYQFADIDVVLLEGILLFQRRFVRRYDLRVWVECSFETAVRRAIERNVEDLPVERLVDDYDRIYHAAQRHHFSVDDPKAHADIVLINEEGVRPSQDGQGQPARWAGRNGGCLKALISKRNLKGDSTV